MPSVIEIIINAINNATSVFDDLKSDIDDVESSASGLGDSLSSIGKNLTSFGTKATIGVSVPIAAAGVAAVKAAGDMEETVNKINTVFGENADQITQWSENSAENFGLSQESALEAAGTLGNLFSSMNFDTAQTTDMSSSLVQLAGDLASFNNIGVPEALEKLQSGIVGETEPLRQLGVNLSAVAVESKALEMGLAANKSDLDEQDKVVARYALIMEQTANAQGDFAATADSLANSQRTTMAELSNLTAELGVTLLPIAKDLVNVLGGLVDAFSNLSPGMQKMFVYSGLIAGVVGPVALGLGAMVSAVTALAPVAGALATALGAVSLPMVAIAAVLAGAAGLVALMFDLGGANEKVASTLENWGMQGAADAVRSLHEWTDKVVTAVQDLFAGNITFAEFFDAAIPEWIETLFSWTWPILGPIAWMVKLMQWAWPTFEKPDWIENLLNFRWPKFPSRPAWLGGDGGNATGTSYFPGGATWVGETGPELVSLPRGSQIFPAGESRRMAAAGMAGGGVNIVINANVTNESDITRLARRVADELQRRGR